MAITLDLEQDILMILLDNDWDSEDFEDDVDDDFEGIPETAALPPGVCSALLIMKTFVNGVQIPIYSRPASNTYVIHKERMHCYIDLDMIKKVARDRGDSLVP